MHSLLRTTLLVGTLALVSCAGSSKPGPLKSQPPRKQIQLAQEASWGGGPLLKKYIFPTGVYTASLENDKGYYYSAPKSITVKDFPLTYGGTGGIYWPKGGATPSKVFVKSLGQYILFKPKSPLVIK